LVEQQTVLAVLNAYREGRIQLDPIRPGTSLKSVRSAPSALFTSNVGKGITDIPYAYTDLTVANFLGSPWLCGSQAGPRVINALAALEAEESKLLSQEERPVRTW
jgi:hypothetical protein